jgi:hypothetical protein
MIPTDDETEVDLLRSGPIETTIVKLLRGRLDGPITVGV